MPFDAPVTTATLFFSFAIRPPSSEASFIRYFDNRLNRLGRRGERLRKFWLELAQVGEVFPPDFAAQAEMGKLSFPADLDQPGVDQFLDVVRQGGGADGHIAAHVAAGKLLAPGDARQDFIAARV